MTEPSLKERQQKFSNSVLSWIAMRDTHGGWDGVAEFFGMTREEVVFATMKDLKEKADECGLTFDLDSLKEDK